MSVAPQSSEDSSLAFPPRCDPRVFREGTCVLITHSIGSWDMEGWVRKVAERSEQPVDWHFSAGRAQVLAMGDLERVRAAIAELLPEHNALQRAAVGELGKHPNWQPSFSLM